MNSTSKNRSKGKFGEVHAAAFLRRKGYTLLSRNYGYRGGELDIVAKDTTGHIVFVEVKTVWNKSNGAPESRVHGKKKFRIWRTACHYLYASNLSMDTPCRFDVVAINCIQSKIHIKHFENAFEATQTIPMC